MANNNNEFLIMYNLSLIRVVERLHEGNIVYDLTFPNEVPPMTIALITFEDGSQRWDTIPSGNTEMAEGVGRLIFLYRKDTRSQWLD